MSFKALKYSVTGDSWIKSNLAALCIYLLIAGTFLSPLYFPNYVSVMPFVFIFGLILLFGYHSRILAGAEELPSFEKIHLLIIQGAKMLFISLLWMVGPLLALGIIFTPIVSLIGEEIVSFIGTLYVFAYLYFFYAPLFVYAQVGTISDTFDPVLIWRIVSAEEYITAVMKGLALFLVSMSVLGIFGFIIPSTIQTVQLILFPIVMHWVLVSISRFFAEELKDF